MGMRVTGELQHISGRWKADQRGEIKETIVQTLS